MDYGQRMKLTSASVSRCCRPKVVLATAVLLLAGCSQTTGATQPTSVAEQPVANASYASAPCPSPNLAGAPELDLGPDVD
jgi:hypothetical protein